MKNKDIVFNDEEIREFISKVEDLLRNTTRGAVFLVQDSSEEGDLLINGAVRNCNRLEVIVGILGSLDISKTSVSNLVSSIILEDM